MGKLALGFARKFAISMVITFGISAVGTTLTPYRLSLLTSP